MGSAELLRIDGGEIRLAFAAIGDGGPAAARRLNRSESAAIRLAVADAHRV